ncbi:MAG: hypothetical protein JSS66_18945 [Armatimonadetes bacterium]|nr:hypothetical protein [Armatimonadota bacterium]
MAAPYFPRQSSAANWTFTHQFCAPDGAPLWPDLPADLVVTLTAMDQWGCPVLQSSSTDGSGQIAPDIDGYVTVNIAPEKMGALCPGMYDIRMKIVSNNFTIEQLYGRLPVCEGAS